MKKIIVASIVLLSGYVFGITPEEIVRKADLIRNPSESYYMQVEVSDVDNKSLFDVSLQGNSKTLIKTILPRRDKGRNLLMIDENMWVYIPNLRRAIRVSLAQKLSGQAANGDISRMRWSGDYKSAIINTTKKYWELHLKAVKKGLTYDQLKVKVEKKTFHPISATYLTVSGKVMKTASYQNYKKILGKIRPTLIVIKDALKKSRTTNIKILKMKNKTFRKSLFNRQNLK